MKPYIPQPGTIPHKVIEHLKALPAGTEMSTAVLADVIGQPRNSMAACLNSPRNNGALKSRRAENGVFFWSLGDGNPLPPPEDHEPDEPLRRPAPAVVPKPASPFDLRQPRPIKPRDTPAPASQAEPVIHRSEPAPALAPAPAGDRAKFGVYSDNTFCIQRGTDAIWLEPEEFQELAEFIGKTSTQ